MHAAERSGREPSPTHRRRARRRSRTRARRAAARGRPARPGRSRPAATRSGSSAACISRRKEPGAAASRRRSSCRRAASAVRLARRFQAERRRAVERTDNRRARWRPLAASRVSHAGEREAERQHERCAIVRWRVVMARRASAGATATPGRRARSARAVLVERQVGVARRGRLAAVQHDGVVHGRRAAVVQVGRRLGEAPERTGEEHPRGDRPLRRRASPAPVPMSWRFRSLNRCTR